MQKVLKLAGLWNRCSWEERQAFVESYIHQIRAAEIGYRGRGPLSNRALDIHERKAPVALVNLVRQYAISRVEVSRRLKIHEVTIHRWWWGKRYPNSTNLKKLNALLVDVEEEQA